MVAAGRPGPAVGPADRADPPGVTPVGRCSSHRRVRMSERWGLVWTDKSIFPKVCLS